MKPVPGRIGDRRRRAARALASLLVSALLVLGCDGRGSDEDFAVGGVFEPPPTRLRVRAQAMRLAPLGGSERVIGTVRAFHHATLTAETQGRVEARAVEPGTFVEAGGVIVELESSRFDLELRRSEASLRAARTVLAHARREFARGEKLLAQKALSTQQHDDLRLAVERARDEIALAEVARDTARRNLEDARIVAPFAGTLDSLEVNIGDFVSPGTQVATLVDLSRVRIFGGVTAREAARLTPGSVARISFADLGGEAFEATLKSVGRVADPADGTYEIELWMDDAERRMRDGLVARIEFPDPEAASSLLAPRAALLRREGRPEVFVVAQEDGVWVARSRRVRTGRSQGDSIEILEGLAEGERVVWDGHFALDDGAVVVVDGVAEVASAAPGGPLPPGAGRSAGATPLSPGATE